MNDPAAAPQIVPVSGRAGQAAEEGSDDEEGSR